MFGVEDGYSLFRGSAPSDWASPKAMVDETGRDQCALSIRRGGGGRGERKRERAKNIPVTAFFFVERWSSKKRTKQRAKIIPMCCWKGNQEYVPGLGFLEASPQVLLARC